MNIAKDKLHETLNLANKLGMEECSHHIRYADDCPECERVWDEAYPPTISKAAYDGALNENATLRESLINLLDVFERCEAGFPPEIELRFLARDLAKAALCVERRIKQYGR